MFPYLLIKNVIEVVCVVVFFFSFCEVYRVVDFSSLASYKPVMRYAVRAMRGKLSLLSPFYSYFSFSGIGPVPYVLIHYRVLFLSEEWLGLIKMLLTSFVKPSIDSVCEEESA